MAPFDVDPFTRFQNWVEQHKVRGVCITDPDNEYFFVRREDLRTYWTHVRISEIYNSQPATRVARYQRPFAHQVIIDKHLQLFSTCVHISSASSSQLLLFETLTHDHSDSDLPLSRPPSSESEPHRLFFERHFLFAPFLLGSSGPTVQSKHLPFRAVVPLADPVNLRAERRKDPSVVKYTVLPENGLPRDVKKIVLKAYHSPDGRPSAAFFNERYFYNVLADYCRGPRATVAQYFPAYHGWFTQADKAVLLIGHSNAGSLSDLFVRNTHMNTKEELLALWQSMLDAVRGVAFLHNMRNHPERFRGIHQDLKPSNILVSHDPRTNVYTFKIGDFGHSSLRSQETNEAAETPVPVLDSMSTKMYSAPELCRRDPELHYIPNAITPAADMWSLGCVLLEVACWSVCGNDGSGLARFRRERSHETAKDSQLHDRGYDACFFVRDGDPSPAIKAMIDRMARSRRVWDTLSVKLAKFTLDYLLCKDPDRRLNALQASGYLQQILDEFSEQASLHDSYRGQTPIPSTISLSTTSSTATGHAGDLPETDQGSSLPAELRDMSTYPARDQGAHNDTWSANLTTPGRSNSLAARMSGANRGHSRQSLPAETGYWEEHVLDPVPNNNKDIAPQTQRARDAPTALDIRTDVSASPAIETPRSPQRRSSRYGEADALAAFPGYAERPLPWHETQAASGAPYNYQDAAVHSGNGARPPSSPYAAGPQRPQALARSSFPDVRKDEIIAWRRRRRDGWVPDIRGLSGAKNILKDRDQLFLIDDSSSMRGQWTNVVDTVLALGYIVKTVDPDKVDLRVTSDPSKSYKARNSTQMVDWVSNQLPLRNGTVCKMADALRTVLADVSKDLNRTYGPWSRRPKGISIYVLTNAIWDSASPSGGHPTSSRCLGVDDVVRNFLDRLMSTIGQPKYASFQFIRFEGGDHACAERLRYLDDGLSATIPGGHDVVDTKHHNDNVWSILIGSVRESEDEYLGEAAAGQVT